MAGSVNKVILIGNLGADPEVRSFANGGKVCNLRIATSETWRDKNTGERKEKTEWHSVAIFNEGLVRIAEQYLRKGSKVYIEGQLQTRKWQDQSGQDRYSTEVVLQGFNGTLTMLDGRGEGGGGGGGMSSGSDQGGYVAAAAVVVAAEAAARPERSTTRSRSKRNPFAPTRKAGAPPEVRIRSAGLMRPAAMPRISTGGSRRRHPSKTARRPPPARQPNFGIPPRAPAASFIFPDDASFGANANDGCPRTRDGIIYNFLFRLIAEPPLRVRRFPNSARTEPGRMSARSGQDIKRGIRHAKTFQRRHHEAHRRQRGADRGLAQADHDDDRRHARRILRRDGSSGSDASDVRPRGLSDGQFGAIRLQGQRLGVHSGTRQRDRPGLRGQLVGSRPSGHQPGRHDRDENHRQWRHPDGRHRRGQFDHGDPEGRQEGVSNFLIATYVHVTACKASDGGTGSDFYASTYVSAIWPPTPAAMSLVEAKRAKWSRAL